MGRVEQLRQRLVEEFTRYDSWEEFLHNKQQFEQGKFERIGE